MSGEGEYDPGLRYPDLQLVQTVRDCRDPVLEDRGRSSLPLLRPDTLQDVEVVIPQRDEAGTTLTGSIYRGY